MLTRDVYGKHKYAFRSYFAIVVTRLHSKIKRSFRSFFNMIRFVLICRDSVFSY